MGLLIKDRIEDISFEEWDDVLARSVRPSPFLSRRFLVPWAKTFAAGRPLRIARWERGGRAEGFLFLCRRAESEEWELLGSDRVSDSLDAVVAAGMEGEFWAELLRSPREMLAEGPLHLQIPGRGRLHSPSSPGSAASGGLPSSRRRRTVPPSSLSRRASTITSSSLTRRSGTNCGASSAVPGRRSRGYRSA